MKTKSLLTLKIAGWCAVCALVLGIYGYAAHPGAIDLLSANPADNYYNLLARGFRAGQLSLPKEAPPGLARLPHPYDPTANAPYRMVPGGAHDLSYYRGKFYLYFGAVPALILFWPFTALTGRYLWHWQAAVIFCALGFVVGAGLLRALRRRYFVEAADGTMVAGVLAFGLTTGLPVLLARSEVYEVAISCGYMLTLLALAAIWLALHRPEQRGRWLAAASAAYGLAVATRPSLLPGAVCLLIPLLGEWREGGRLLRRSLCALGPIAAIGLGLMFYNYERFGQALEFGQHYQLASDRQEAARHFSLHYLWFNFRVYFLEPVRWTWNFPFLQRPAAPPRPSGHALAEDPLGILTTVPWVWLALAAPCAWRNRAREAGVLRRFVLAVAVLFGASALTLGLFYGSCSRYEVEFLPELVLLAIVGMFAVERRLAGRPDCRAMARCGWGLLLAWSVAFNLLAGVVNYADARNDYGVALENAGRTTEAIRVYEQVLRLTPRLAVTHLNLGNALFGQRRLAEAMAQFDETLRLDPDSFAARTNRGNLLVQTGRFAEAIVEYERALRLEPDSAGAHANLGFALAEVGRRREAIGQYEEALRIRPNYPEVLNDLSALRGAP